MKLVFIAIFSVILLVVCEPQQDSIGDGEAPGLYYNFGKRYGWNFDNRHDENNRYEEVDRSYSLDRGRDTKKEHDSREQSGRRDSDRGQRLDHGRYNKEDSKSREKYNERDSNHGQRLDYGRDTKKEYDSREQSGRRTSDRDQRLDHDRYNKEDSESREKYKQRDSDHGQRLDRGRDSKNNYNSREQTYYHESESGRDDHRGYEHNHQRNDRHRDKQNESSENQRGEAKTERRNHNYKYNYENQRNDRQHDKNYNESYDKVDNRDDKTRDDSKNRDYSRDDQSNDRNQDKHRNKDHEYKNRKDNKSRVRNNERDRDQGYGNEHRANDRNKSKNYDINNNGRQYQNENDRQRENMSQEHGFERQDKDKHNKYDNGNYNYGPSKNQDRKENKSYESVNSRQHEGQEGILHKDKEGYGHILENSVQKADYNYKEQDKDGWKQNPIVITEGYKEYKKDDRNPPYRYSYIESLITAPIQNEKEDHPSKQVQEKKKEVEIQGIISKNKDLNNKEVEVDVIVKKNDSTQGKVHESIRNLDHKQVNLKEELHKHKVSYLKPEKDSITLKPKEEIKHENNKIGNVQGNYGEKNYREGYNNFIQGKKDLLGGIDLFSLLGNIGQEFKEQVIERIPGYHLIQNLEHREQKSGIKQPYKYNLDMKGPKIDLEVYRPDFMQNEEKEKKVEKIKVIKEKEIDMYAKIKGKERKENDQQGERKAVYDYSISHKPVSLDDMNKNKYIENKDYEYRVKIDEGQKVYKPQAEREYYIYGNVNQKDQGNYNQQNSGNQVPNYLNQQSRDDQGLGYQGFGYVNQNNRGYINQDLSEYQDQGYWNQKDKINQVEPDYKKKQKDEKYIFQYTIGNNLEQGFGKPSQKNLNIPHFLQYDDRSQGLNNKQGDVSRQGLENRGDDNRKYNDYRNQQVTKVNNGYPDLSYINKGNPDYISKYNQGIIGSGYDVYQAQHYPIPELVNPLTQQILASVGTVQDFYNQNYSKSFVNWSNENKGYNVNPYLGDYGYPENYNNHNYERSFTKPGYDTSYQGSNKEYTYQYQLPYSNVFARVGLPYAIFSVILLVACEPQQGPDGGQYGGQLSGNPHYIHGDRNHENRRSNDRNRDHHHRNNRHRDREDYNHYGRQHNEYERVHDINNHEREYEHNQQENGKSHDTNIQYREYGREHKEYDGHLGTHRDGHYSQDRQRVDNHEHEGQGNYENPYYKYDPGYISPERHEPNPDVYQTFPHPDLVGRTGLGFQRRTALVNGFTSPITKESLQIVGSQGDLMADKNYHGLNEYYENYGAVDRTHEQKYDYRDPYYMNYGNSYEGSNLHADKYEDIYRNFPYRDFVGRTGLGFQKRAALVRGFTSPLTQELLETVGKNKGHDVK